jgi:hypothetical protein
MRVPSLPPPLAFFLILLAPPPTSPGEMPPFAKTIPSLPSGPPIFSFNGRDLSGFYTFTRDNKYQDPDQVFSVHDGMVRVSGRETGGLTTRDSFSNYHLIVEWKWGNKTWTPRRFQARNSGILVHSRGPDGDALASWMESIECQIIEGGSGDLLVVSGKGPPPSLSSEVRIGPDGQPYYQKGGALKTLKRFGFHWWGRDPGWKDVLWFRGPDDIEKPVGEWNRMEVVCDGDTILCILNGTLVNVGIKSSLTSGKILFQSEGAEIFFRTIEVRSLSK